VQDGSNSRRFLGSKFYCCDYMHTPPGHNDNHGVCHGVFHGVGDSHCHKERLNFGFWNHYWLGLYGLRYCFLLGNHQHQLCTGVELRSNGQQGRRDWHLHPHWRRRHVHRQLRQRQDQRYIHLLEGLLGTTVDPVGGVPGCRRPRPRQQRNHGDGLRACHLRRSRLGGFVNEILDQMYLFPLYRVGTYAL